MTTTKKIVLAIAALIIVGLLVVVGVTGGALGEVKCMDCHGTGLVEDAECTHCDAETHMITCPKCDGASVVEGVNCDACKNAGEVDCPYCKDGVIATAPCETCGGSGKVAGSPWALLPPIIAIALALITKEVYSSLFIGIITGALMYTNFDVLKTVDTVVNDGLISAVSATAGIFIFLIELGVIVALVNKAGGSAAFGKWAARHINIDATAAPVCMIAPISSWAAAVASYTEDGQGIKLFIMAIPFNFYSLLTFVFIIALCLMNFDYGSMALHEYNAQYKNDLFTSGDRVEEVNDEPNEHGKVIDLILPIIVLIVISVFALVYNGGILDGTPFVDAFAGTDATVGLPWGGLLALIFTMIYLNLRKIISLKDAMAAIPKGFIAMVPPILILTFATALKEITGLMGAKYFVANMMEGAAGSLQNFLPAIIFIVACILAFATGTSWGTFGILIPIVTYLFATNPDSPLKIIGISACLAGAVCGDHCSPISDTTIMSSAGARCNHINHVSTQLPYALTVAGVSFVSFIIAGFVQIWYIALPIAIALMIGTMVIIKFTRKNENLLNKKSK